jgi:hypothetical protein
MAARLLISRIWRKDIKMANSLFSPCAGSVVRVQLCDDDAKVFSVSVAGTDLTTKFPVSSYTLEMAGNYQFLHALDGFVYFHSFGDRIGELSVAGLGMLTKPCPEEAAQGGASDLYGFYEDNKQSKSQKAVNIIAGGKIDLRGFLTGMRIEVNASAGVPLAQWSLRFHVLPPRH